MKHHGANLGVLFGSRDPDHIARFVQAGIAGRRTAPKCEAISKLTGSRCCRLVMRGSKLCFLHRRGAVSATTDAEQARHNLKVLNSDATGRNRERALKSLARIARAEVYRSWRLDPRAPVIDLLALEPADEARVVAWLKDNHQLDLNGNLPGTDRPPTARCRDRLRYAAWRVIARGPAASPEFVKKAGYRVVNALRDDARFWEKLAKLDQLP